MTAVTGIPTTILLAPDSFKGTFSAVEVAAAIARGLEAAGWPVDPCPVADGGEGTLAALLGALGGELVHAAVEDPLGRVVEASFALTGGGAGARGAEPVAVVETASASGLGLVAETDRDPVAASTRGTGQLIVAAVEAGARSVLLGVGGSATTDGGAGAVAAIREAGGLAGARLTVLCDVQTPFEDAARVYAAQKGADRDAVRRLTRRLGDHARRLPRDPRGVPMTGAAGGLSGGLWASFGAELVAGAAFVLDTLGFDPRMRAARAVVTGEGRLDRQSLAGKAVSEVATRARQAGVPCHAIVGEGRLDAFGARILDLQAILEASTLAEIEAAAVELGALL
ncbi:MAG TPA: glycerate kinase [Solirubrobacteraceae bacterium]|nr:glycerate kinase [Solirubrobacteraceae bacterium]